MSPMSRSLGYLRDNGWLCDISERRAGPNTHDLFTIADIVAIKGREVLFVQTTSASNVSARVKKIAAATDIGRIREAGISVHVHGWKPGKPEPRVVDCS